MDAVTLWRCSVCGKWSHAKQRPKSHLRFVKDRGQDTENASTIEGLPVKEYDEGWDDGVEGRAGREGGWWVHCGPFDAWHAQRTP